jgi:hypothetical protein
MKKKILFIYVSLLIVFASIIIWVNGAGAIKQTEANLPLSLKVSADKQFYLQGEAVKLKFEISNLTEKPFRMPYRPDVSTGYLKVWIAFDGQRFNRYNNTSWGLTEGGGTTIQPDQSIISEATVLWNHKPDVSRLNLEAIKNSTEGVILNHYAFPEVGTYSIKAVLTVPGETRVTIESEPIQIVISEPVNDDLTVWNLIKDDRDIAYFIQQNDFLPSKDEERDILLKKVEQIAADYPNSFLAGQIRQSLELFRIKDAKRKETQEKSRQKN